MRYKPHEYQRRASAWVVDHDRCCLFLDMGLGKSVITLTAISDLMDSCDVTRTLVVAPKKVAETTWSDEAEKWDHLSHLRVSRVIGDAKRRVSALEADADIYVIGRDSLVWLVGHYNGSLPFDMIVIDELTSFKSSRSQRFKAMRIATASASRVVGLTGTPAPNGLIDLWAEMYCIDQGERLGKSVTRYRDTYFNQRVWNNIVVKCTVKPGLDKVIMDRISDICLSMRASDLLKLPDLIVHTVRIPLPRPIMDEYEEFERGRVMEFMGEHDGETDIVMANSAAGLMSKLSQFANGAVYDEDRMVHHIHDEKVDRLAEIVEAANGSGVLVFYQYKHDVPRIKERLRGVKVRVYEGEKDLRDWNDGKIEALLAHPASTAYGLNMQKGGHYIVWFGTGWNLELYQQANARLHRQGQPHPVTVYNLVCQGTIDERANKALEGKKSVQQGLIDGLNFLRKKYDLFSSIRNGDNETI